jgi:pimeloyl-ACP methyl ester carboxylesterase
VRSRTREVVRDRTWGVAKAAEHGYDALILTEHQLGGEYRQPQAPGLAVRRYGAAAGLPVLALHGTPGAGSKFACFDDLAAQRNLTIIAPDRWGYGRTPTPSVASLAAFADAADALMTAHGVSRYGVLGISGGGPYAAALAACKPDRVAALALVSPVGEMAGAGHELEPLHRLCFSVLPRIPGAIRMVFALLATGLRYAPRTTLRLAYLSAAAPDRCAVADRQLGGAIAELFREGLAQGGAGAALDMRLFSMPWDVQLAEITAPARLWIGTADRNVPVRRAFALGAAIPGCMVDVAPDAGHLGSVEQGARVLDWVASVVSSTHAEATKTR